MTEGSVCAINLIIEVVAVVVYIIVSFAVSYGGSCSKSASSLLRSGRMALKNSEVAFQALSVASHEKSSWETWL